MVQRNMIWIVLLTSAFFAMGCQKAKKQERTRVGFTRSTDSRKSSHEQYGEVTSSNQNSFSEALYRFTLAPIQAVNNSVSLGYVSASSNDDTGMRFYGSVKTKGGNTSSSVREFDGENMWIVFEFYDDVSAKQLQYHFSPDAQIGDSIKWVGASGQLNGYNANLYFENSVAAVTMEGEVDTQYYSGTLSFRDKTTGQTRTIGSFKVPTCGFFHCQ